MTKAELIKFFDEHFADDEEITFLYSDDGFRERGTISGIEDDEKTYSTFHFEVLERGKWVRWTKEGCPIHHASYCKKWGHQVYSRFSSDEIDRSWYRKVIDREWTDVKRCVCIG